MNLDLVSGQVIRSKTVHTNRFVTRFLLVLLLIFTATAVTAVAADPRVVAIGDVHGAYDAFVLILRKAELINDKLQWSGGESILIQTGDFTDRGPGTRAVMDLLMRLQREAPRQKGRVVVLLGNHEMMNIVGDMRYVTADDYAAFVDNRSESRRQAAYQAYSKLEPEESRISETLWMAAHPLGFVEHRQAFGPKGSYGRWLRSLPAAARVGDSVFLHGGISPTLASFTLDGINDFISAEIKVFDRSVDYMVDKELARTFDTLPELLRAKELVEDKDRLEEFHNLNNWMSMHPEGPLWFRGFAQWTDAEGTPHIDSLAAAFKTSRFVVGHTVQEHQIVSRFGGRVFLIDTGMLSSSYPGGRASALVIENGDATFLYAGGEPEDGHGDLAIEFPGPISTAPNPTGSVPAQDN